VKWDLDEETGLYYYGARYLDPKYSRWLSGDPAITDYMAGTSAGEGGIYNTVNLHVYHYAGNNPVKYVDPDGRASEAVGYSGSYTGEPTKAVVDTPSATVAILYMLKTLGKEAWTGIKAVAPYALIPLFIFSLQGDSAKAKEQAKAVAKEEGNRSFGSITIQIQKGTKSIQKGSTRLALNEKGVTKQEAQDALHEQVNMLSNTSGYGKMAKSKTFQEAVIQMSKNIQTKTTTGTCDQKQMRVWFNYNGQNYRIDMFNKGDNLKY